MDLHRGPARSAALAREVEGRAPAIATSKWWKEERHGVFRLQPEREGPDGRCGLPVRPTPDARVSTPLTWDEIDECDPQDFTMATMPSRFAAHGDRHAGMNDAPCSLASLLELSDRHAREGLGDAPWPPHYRKQPNEAARVQPSRRRVSKHPLIEIGRAERKTTRWQVSSDGGRNTPTRRLTSRLPTFWWTRCVAAITRGRACA